MPEIKLTAKWDISYDGWYPYCTNCNYEPSKEVAATKKLPCVCPKCGALITNLDEFYKE